MARPGPAPHSPARLVPLYDLCYSCTYRRSMLTVAALLSISLFLAYLLFPVTFRAVAQPLLTVWWRSNNLPQLVYRKETRYVNDLINNCSILKERYTSQYILYSRCIVCLLRDLKKISFAYSNIKR